MNVHRIAFGLLWGAVLLAVSPVPPGAQAATTAPPPASPDSAGRAPAKPCSAPEYRQFDFWIGDWQVTTPDGRVAGTNTIEPLLGGCALQEHWRGGAGGAGTSLSFYDAASGQWHQTWVSAQGGLLQLDGGIEDGKMVLTGERPSLQDQGTAVLHRISWEQRDADHVHQLWEASSDGGKTWTVVFEGTYTRVKA